MKTLALIIGIAALFLATGAAHARGKGLDTRDCLFTDPPSCAEHLHKEGAHDYYSGLCYRARPYLDSPEKAVYWERGFRSAQRRNHNRVDRSHCRGTTR